MPECVPCNACPAPPAPACTPCPCRTCCCGKPAKVNPCYKQPKIPDSYAPRRCYVKPTAPVEGCTTYKLSYLPTCDSKNLRGVARKPAPNLVPSCEPMEGCTVQKLSFLPNPVCVTQPIRPCHHDMWGQGPMQAITTQRHDYVPKPSVLRESCKPPPKFHCVEQPFESKSPESLRVLLSTKLSNQALLSNQDLVSDTAPRANLAINDSFQSKSPISKTDILVSAKDLVYATDTKLATGETVSSIPVTPHSDSKRPRAQDLSPVSSVTPHSMTKKTVQAETKINILKRKRPPFKDPTSKGKGIIAPFATDTIAKFSEIKNPCDIECECHQSNRG